MSDELQIKRKFNRYLPLKSTHFYIFTAGFSIIHVHSLRIGDFEQKNLAKRIGCRCHAIRHDGDDRLDFQYSDPGAIATQASSHAV